MKFYKGDTCRALMDGFLCRSSWTVCYMGGAILGGTGTVGLDTVAGGRLACYSKLLYSW
jgi:hypothetical protein